jgi:glycine cleavage system H protein
MDLPKDRRFLATHEWHKLDGDIVTIGLTQFAVDELTDITFVTFPKVGQIFTAGQRFGEIESVKATSDLYTGVGGSITEINAELTGNPGLVNTDPYGKGWLVRVKTSKPDEFNQLLAADAYLKKIGR